MNGKSKNMYQEGVKLILSSKLGLKNIQSFQGRDGHGASANIYWKNKKVGTYLDEAHGGEEYIDYECQELNDFLKSLPKFSHNEWLGSVNYRSGAFNDGKDDIRENTWKWYWANVLIGDWWDKKDMKRLLRTACCFNLEEKNFTTWKIKPSEVDNKFNFKEEQQISFRNFVGKYRKNCVLLNGLPQDEIMKYYKMARK